jgi:FkbM family methyltransferase
MIPALRRMLKDALGRFDLDIVKRSNLARLKTESRAMGLIEMPMVFPGSRKTDTLLALRNSNSQLGQDLFVITELDFKTSGYFVDFGATNGIDSNNSYLLEKEFGWSGIVAEPAKRWHKDLKMNRHCSVETDCVWRDSNSILTFNETDYGEYSTIDAYGASDHHRQDRETGRRYEVKTISLLDLLEKHHAPREIDYLSVDTEGSEYEILSNFSFDRYRFRIITCEHNFTPARDKIFDLLTQNGYVRKFEEVSNFDDWYVRPGADGASV